MDSKAVEVTSIVISPPFSVLSVGFFVFSLDPSLARNELSDGYGAVKQKPVKPSLTIALEVDA